MEVLFRDSDDYFKQGGLLKESDKKDFRLTKILKNPFFMLTFITTVITFYLLEKQMFIGVPYYDVFVYLNNALIFAGIPVGNMSVIYLSPLMPLLTSLVFRAGYISENVIFIMDGFIFVFGIIGLYLLFKERFNEIQSFTGCLIFLSFPLIFAWAVSGGIDVPGVSFSIWTIYMLVLGVKKDKKFLYLVFPLFMVAFLTRYTSVILIFPIILYLLLNKDLIQNMKRIGMGLLAGLVVVSPFLVYVYNKLGNMNPFLNIFTSTLLGSGATVNDLGYNPVKLFFLNNILNYISTSPLQGIYGYIQSPHRGYPSILSYIIAIIASIGLGIYLYQIYQAKIGKFKVSHRNKTILHLTIIILLTFLGIWSFFTSSYLVTELIFLGFLYAGYRFFIDTPVKNIRIDFLFLSWFIAFFIFHSIIPLKEDRYFITMSPALAYFIILGLSTFIEKFKYKIKNQHMKTYGMYLTVGLLLLSYTTAEYAGHVTQEGYGFYIGLTCDWLKEYDPHYQDKVIYSNYDPAVTWYLKKNVKFGVPRLYVNSEAFSNYLKAGKADYYVDAYSTSPPIPGYHIIKNIETVSVYERDY
ncbi:MAG: hypothetical protein A4E27_01050 [Methanobacterium sp. PtaU1.Bin242]|nr:MAG: hypothetical protein A4E27_01050 [Methanobacterium sp. PtaU1.Bin242]